MKLVCTYTEEKWR